VTFRNLDGEWSIWKTCYTNGTDTVGPGYIARLTASGALIFDDFNGPSGEVNNIRGGLGGFGAHYSRGPGQSPLESRPPGYTDDITGRTCYFATGRPGVYAVTIREAPTIDPYGTGVFGLTVWLRDMVGQTGYGPDSDGNGVGDAGIKLDYDFRIYGSVIYHWATVTTYFAQVGNDAAWVKEPKFVANLRQSQAGYTRISLFRTGTEPSVMTHGQTTVGPTLTGNFPDGGRHSGDDNRLRVRYDFGNTTDPNSPRCGPCLNVLFRSSPGPGVHGAWGFWENGSIGLDRWALDASLMPGLMESDQANSNPNHGFPYSWDCNAGANPMPSNGGVRRWEFHGASTGGNYTPYTRVGTLATGWEGGRGAFDCEPLSRPFEVGRSYSVRMDYSVNDGW
jgi:hypothetical protein